ncbi:MAG: FHA domain-containing protein [Roseburia hominis]
MDTNSTNHTYVNGVMIRSNEEVVLSEGDKIRLANEEFVFHG